MMRAKYLWFISLAGLIVVTTALVIWGQNGDAEMSETGDAQEFVGQHYTNVTTQLGTPASEEEFTLEMGVPEFRIELLNFYSQDDLETDAPLIRESTWNRSDEQNLTLWFVRKDDDWLALHYLLWHPDAEF